MKNKKEDILNSIRDILCSLKTVCKLCNNIAELHLYKYSNYKMNICLKCINVFESPNGNDVKDIFFHEYGMYEHFFTTKYTMRNNTDIRTCGDCWIAYQKLFPHQSYKKIETSKKKKILKKKVSKKKVSEKKKATKKKTK